MVAATKAIKNAGGLGIPTVKPWNIEVIREKMAMVKDSGAFAVAMDIDAAGLPFLKNLTPPAGSKSVEDLREVKQAAGLPFIVKGIMTVKGAMKAKEAGADAIVVSNHGGRVLDQCPATAEVLEEIANAVDGSMKIFVDGGIRSGVDVFKALALGADAVIIARPFVTAVYGGAQEGVEAYVNKIGSELKDTMAMCGVASLKEIPFRGRAFRAAKRVSCIRIRTLPSPSATSSKRAFPSVNVAPEATVVTVEVPKKSMLAVTVPSV